LDITAKPSKPSTKGITRPFTNELIVNLSIKEITISTTRRIVTLTISIENPK
jgi:hypothetical protein